MMKKAQLSVETMIIYGLVILVALSAIGALIYFNILDLGSYLPDTCNLGGSGDLKCEEMKLVAGGNFELGIRNIGQKPIELLRVTVIDDEAIHFTSSPKIFGTDKGGADIDPSNALPPGEMAIISWDPGADVIQGKVLKGSLKTEYKFKDGAITQESFGSIRIKAS